MSDATTGGAPGVQSHVPGQDASDESAAGVAPGASDLDAATDPDASAGDALDGSGDSLGDDAVPPQRDASDDDDAAEGRGASAGETDASSGS